MGWFESESHTRFWVFFFIQSMWLGSSEHLVKSQDTGLLGHCLTDAVQPGVMNRECRQCYVLPNIFTTVACLTVANTLVSVNQRSTKK